MSNHQMGIGTMEAIAKPKFATSTNSDDERRWFNTYANFIRTAKDTKRFNRNDLMSGRSAI